MGFVLPIEPLVHLPTEQVLVDCRDDAERRRDLNDTSIRGLSQLIRHPETPSMGMQGIQRGIWGPTGMRGLYLVREEHPHADAIEKTRTCIVGALRPAEDSPFVPVVTASRAAVDATAEHLRAGGADPAGVAALYRDEDLQLERLAESYLERPAIVELKSPDGRRFKVWCLSPDESDSAAQMLERNGGAIVGDVTLYRAVIRLRDDPIVAPDCHPTVRFYNQRDFGLAFASTVRLFARVPGFDVNAAIHELYRRYEIEELPLTGAPQELRSFNDRVRSEGINGRAVGLMMRGMSSAYVVKVTPESPIELIGHENPPEIAAEFDAEWVEKGILRQLYPALTLQASTVLTDGELVRDQLDGGAADLAFFVNPPPKRHLPLLAQSRWRLPAESMHLVPTVPRGLILTPLKPALQS